MTRRLKSVSKERRFSENPCLVQRCQCSFYLWDLCSPISSSSLACDLFHHPLRCPITNTCPSLLHLPRHIVQESECLNLRTSHSNTPQHYSGRALVRILLLLIKLCSLAAEFQLGKVCTRTVSGIQHRHRRPKTERQNAPGVEKKQHIFASLLLCHLSPRQSPPWTF